MILIVSFLISSPELSYKEQAGKTKWPIHFKDEETFLLRAVDQETSVKDPKHKMHLNLLLKGIILRGRNIKC